MKGYVSGGKSPQALLGWTEQWITHVKQKTGRQPIIYTGDLWKSCLGNPVGNLGCPLWLAQYNSYAQVPEAWLVKSWLFWQYTNKANVSGIGLCDFNRFQGAHSDLINISQGHSLADPEPTPWPGYFLRIGSRGRAISLWQSQLRSRGFVLAADGIYGPESQRACKQLQAQTRLPRDGIVGPLIWQASWKK